MKKFKIISPLLILLALVGFSAHAASAVVGTCDSGSGTNSGFWFFQHMRDNQNLKVEYETANNSDMYNNSQLPSGLHCLPLIKPDASIRVCMTVDNEQCFDLRPSEQPSTVQSASCFEDIWAPRPRATCYWDVTRPKPSPPGTPGIIKATCELNDPQEPSKMGFWFRQHNTRTHMSVAYLKITGTHYNNSELGEGLHCLPPPAQGASIKICEAGGDDDCFTTTVDLDNAEGVTCNNAYDVCGWSSVKPT